MIHLPPLWKYALAMVALLLVTGVYVFLEKQKNLFPDHTAVITEIKSLNRLETASFTIEKIIENGTHGNVFQELLFGDRILLIAHGEAVAGVDLSKIREEDISIDNTSIAMTLPSPEVFSVRIDNKKTSVYDRTKGLLTAGDKSLESGARIKAEETIRQAACDGNILETAGKNAVDNIHSFLQLAGYTNIVVNVLEGECVI